MPKPRIFYNPDAIEKWVKRITAAEDDYVADIIDQARKELNQTDFRAVINRSPSRRSCRGPVFIMK
jgi:hypothetical protein